MRGRAALTGVATRIEDRLVRDRTTESGARRAEVADVADTFVELMRTFNRARARILAAAAHDVEWSAHVLLKFLQTDGPMRAGALAELMQSDPSTVSRQVATLVRDGLLERRADPHDGRASLLVLTPKADAVLIDHHRIRLDHFQAIVDGWSDAELHQFAGMLRRFTSGYEAENASFITERFGRRTDSPPNDDLVPEDPSPSTTSPDHAGRNT